jgi:uridine kinase
VSGDLDEIVARVLAALPGAGRALVAVDGIGASGKSTVAARIAERITTRPVLVLHADDFFHPAAVRHARGRHSAEGFWLDTYDLDALVTWALMPLRADCDGLYRAASYDRSDGTATRPEPLRAPDDAVVLVEGTFLHRDELVGFWDASVYLDVPFAVAARRMVERDGLDPDDKRLRRYEGGQRLYFRSAAPWERATFVVDTTDLGSPVLVDAAGVAASHRADA